MRLAVSWSLRGIDLFVRQRRAIDGGTTFSWELWLFEDEHGGWKGLDGWKEWANFGYEGDQKVILRLHEEDLMGLVISEVIYGRLFV